MTTRITRSVQSPSHRLLPTLVSFFLFLLCLPAWGGDLSVTSAADPQTLKLGERMYRDGLLPNGEPMTAILRGDVKVPGNAFSCVSCHLRSGIGSVEGQILSPPTNGLKLSKPYYQFPPQTDVEYGRVKKGMWDGRAPGKPLYRGAYNEETLADAIRAGFDPGGRELNSAMPRYDIDNSSMTILITYLKSLSAEFSPGVDTEFKYIRFATVIAGDVPADERKEMMALLEGIMAHHNREGQKKNRYQNLGTKMQPAPFNYPVFSITPWELKGEPSTWRAQMEEYYRNEPVFALLGGLSATDWQPMHDFCEQHEIPSLLPVTDLPVISDSAYYTLYFSKGVYQEGESAARYLNLNLDQNDDAGVLQIVEDTPRGRATARGFLENWKELGHTAPATVYLKPGETVSKAKKSILAGEKHPSVLLLWTTSGTLADLEDLAKAKEAPRMVFVSATLLQKDVMMIPEAARAITYISYPYRIDDASDLFTNDAKFWMKQRDIPMGDKRIATRLYTLTNVLLEPFRVVKRDFNPAGQGDGKVIMEEQFETLMHVKRNYYRDYLFDVIGMFGDRPSLEYERLSFGPGQRYMSKGGYIAQLTPGPKPHLVKKSDWVIY
jgi:hypothetical protein